MKLSARTRLAADNRAPALARAFVQRELVGLRLPVSDVVLVASELVTNAVRAGSSTIEVILVGGPSGLELTVADDAAGVPRQRSAGPEALSGRGLGIVAELADSWRTTAARSGDRKRVTARWEAR